MSQAQSDIDALLAEAASLAAVAPAPEPYESPEPAPSPAVASGAGRSQLRSDDLQRILRVEVPVIVKLAECDMPVSRIIGLSPGAIIEFEKPAEDPLDLMINNQRIGSGQTVKVGENFGLRVFEIGTLQEKIAALGGR